MEEKRFAIVAPPKWAALLPVGAATLVTIGLAVALSMDEKTQLPPVAWAAFALVPVLAALLALDMFHRDVRLTDKGLRLRTLPWRSTVPLQALDLERAEIVDLESRRELMPGIKIAGSRLPGYRSGHFWLRDRRRASVLVTDPRRVLLLPRRDGSVLLLSLQQPEALLRALRRMYDGR